jgi:hypothetical protein
MRHIQLNPLLAQLFADADGQKAKALLDRAHKKLARKRSPKTRKTYIDKNGSGKWKSIKDRLTATFGQKCWYTEVELIGSPLAIDHYRPVCDYWWLAFDAENYRVSCPWANSPEHNAQHGCAGGKGDNFPLLPPALRATRRTELPNEHPIILDPCDAADCDLLAFQADGRPVLNPDFAADATARRRVDESMLLLNLDHSGFNTQREQMCHDIADDVHIHEALPANSAERVTIRTRLESRLAPNAPFSTAARYYLQLHRHLDWVETILQNHNQRILTCPPPP